MRNVRVVRACLSAVSLGLLLPLLALVVLPAPPATATGAVGHTGLVPWSPRTDVPTITTGEIRDMLQWGDRIILAGSFTEVVDNGGATVPAPYLVAYNVDTGELDPSFAVQVDREVNALALSPDGQYLYLGGVFNSVDGETHRKIAKVRADGTVVSGFVADADSRVTTLAVSDSSVYVGGLFNRINTSLRGKLAALDPDTGAVDPGFDLPVTEGVGRAALLKVHRVLVNPAGTRLVVVHSGRRVAGQIRTGIAVIDTVSKQLTSWYAPLYEDNLPRVGGVLRINNGDISPDGSYVVVVSGSGGDRPPTNDTAVAFPVAGTGTIEPLWVSRHFDSVFGVGITEQAVYVGGHFRWQESPTASDPWPGDADTNYGWDAGLGAYALGDEVVRRDQIGALDPATGKALNWDPSSDARVGVQVLVPIERGLLAYQDGHWLGDTRVERHAFFDFATAANPDDLPTSTIADPLSGVTLRADPHTYSGDAHATGGINRVLVRIKDRNSDRFLQADGTLSTGSYAFDATLASPGAADSAWSIDLAVPESGSFEVRTVTVGIDTRRQGDFTRSKFEVNASDDLPPETAITAPSRSAPPTSTTFTIAGTARDDLGVASVRLVIQNQDTREYLQDDFTASADYHAFVVPVDPAGGQVVNWSYDVTVPYGTWRIRANATDTSGQIDNGFVVTTVTLSEDTVTNLSPTLVVAQPVLGSTVAANTPVTISGTATDADGSVDQVTLRITNLQTTEGVTSAGTWGVPGFTNAVVTGPDQAGVYTWSFTTPDLPPGAYSVSARVVDDLGARGSASGSFVAQVPGDAPPETVFDQASPDPDQNRDDLHFTLTGAATDDHAVARVAVTIQESYSLLQAPPPRPPPEPSGSAYTELPGDAQWTGRQLHLVPRRRPARQRRGLHHHGQGGR
ncbi:MAG: Ig-like domain-containing protein [Nocardioides sp.]